MKQEKLPDEHHLEMVPWYSMFLFNTAFELMVSLKLFLGRFDHRSLQRAIHSSDDNYIFDHLASRDEVWLDFVADCGDGFDSSYQVARLLAQPDLEVECSAIGRKGEKKDQKRNEKRVYPRGDVLIVGGDLAYPHPNAVNYEVEGILDVISLAHTSFLYQSRFWRVFEYAMKPPSFYDPTAVSARKLGLAPYHKAKGNASAMPSAPFLNNYEGPCAFAIPGNHDWFDGLSTFNRFVCNRDWLGGWHLPQKTSHFILKLPKGWWLIAVDLALEDDINTEQFELFQRVAEKSIQAEDGVIIVTHEPRWILDGIEGREKSEEKLTYLITRVFNGRVVVRLAGDIHNYMRHSLVTGVQADDTKLNSDMSEKPQESSTTRPRADSKRSSHNMAREYFPHMYDTATASIERKDRDEQAGEEARPGAIKHFFVSGGGGAFLHPTHAPECDTIQVNGSTYMQSNCYPPKHVSKRYALLNVFGFRRINWRFDVIGGLGYFCLIASMFPRCSVREIYKSGSWLAMLQLFILEVCAVQYEMMSTSYVSLTTYVYMLVTLVFFADCTSFTKQVMTGAFMSWIHCIAASACLIFYECIVDFAILKGGLGQEGSHSLFQYFTTNVFSFSGLTSIQTTQTTIEYIVELYFSFMRFCMSAFDIPEVVAIHRSKICSSGFEALTRFEMWTYYLSVFPYFFVLAAPVVGFVFGLYLYLSLNLWGVHYNEAFSALRISSYKNFLRLHIQPNGDLIVHAIGIDKMPRKWGRDPAWSGGRNHPEQHKPSYEWSSPSYWKPVSTRVSNMLRIDFENRRFDGKFDISDRSNANLIDRVLIKKPSHIVSRKHAKPDNNESTC
uniref:Uncharacterized protein AlNc14C303G10413 n=1 Tax=Albugo laibachii Nc14 TaxID=890382 RepID=F0WVS6_9STRA|nr:conserved hypothetical protein [Albugo laibachii Nc14]|eukprot:CCA25522.1 conserved hypothetical protein [Albugo laibachii Nc14]